MIGTLLLAGAALYLGTLAAVEDAPTMAGLFWFGTVVAAGGAVVWFLDHRSRVRSQR